MKRAPWFLSLALSLAAACSHAQTRAEPAPSATTPAMAVVPAPAAAPAAAAPRSCSADAQCDARQLCVRDACVAITPALEECGVTRVHFAFDQADLEQDELVRLQRIGRCLTADRTVHVVVEGNADERGTVEYNLHLGDRRANAVERYLEGLGVPSDQLATVTYGKEIPVCLDHTEACWARNRRTAVVPNGEPKAIAHIEKLDERSEQARKTAGTPPMATHASLTAPATKP